VGHTLGEGQKAFSLLSPAVQRGDPRLHQDERRVGTDKIFG
jgi:hypothetical protein